MGISIKNAQTERLARELARETGEPVRLFVSPTRPDAARYARTRFLDVGYRPAPADISPDALVSLLESARALLESNERSLKREALSEVFPGAL